MSDTNINIQGSPNSEVNILLGKSYQFNDLLDQLNTQQRLFDLTPENDTDERLRISKKLNDLTDLIEQFKRDVLALAQTFAKIEINTDRLRRAKEFFDQGDIGEARAVLETELEQMQSEQTHLLKEKEHFEQDVLPNLINNSEEFYLLAMATQANYDNPNRFTDTCRYFEDSIKSYATKNNVFQYAYFLDEHNQFNEAVNYYSKYLTGFSSRLSEDEYATTLNNLGILHTNQNKYEEALNEYEEALAIRRKLAETNPNTYLPNIATTLNNLANLHTNQNKYEEALDEYEEALAIRRKLAETNPNTYLPDVAMTLNNLPVLHTNQNKYEEALDEYEEALTIYRKLAETNPNTYLPDVATTLNNLAILHSDQNKYEEALNEYEEALTIYRKLAETNPNTYLPHVAMTLVNLSIYFQDAVPQRERSVKYVIEAMVIIKPIVDKIPYTQRYMQRALLVLKNWDLNDDEIEVLIAEKMKENKQN